VTQQPEFTTFSASRAHQVSSVEDDDIAWHNFFDWYFLLISIAKYCCFGLARA
jgi:hypothetical protein